MNGRKGRALGGWQLMRAKESAGRRDKRERERELWTCRPRREMVMKKGARFGMKGRGANMKASNKRG